MLQQREAQMPFITPRLALRLPEPADAGRIADLIGDFGVAGNLSRVPHPYGLPDAQAWIAARPSAPAPHETALAIVLAGEGLCGVVGFHAEPMNRTVIGYWIGRPFWGRGIATEAAQAALGWYFVASDAATIGSGAFVFNAASLAIQAKLGFVETGRSMRRCLARGADLEHVDTRLERTRFEARHRHGGVR